MASSSLEFVGEIVEVFPAGKYQVRLVDMDMLIIGRMSGKMKMNRISVMQGDYVKIELSEYDTSQGRIVYRFKTPQQAILSMKQAAAQDSDTASPAPKKAGDSRSKSGGSRKRGGPPKRKFRGRR